MPKFSKFWQDAHACKIDTVLVWKFDRFSHSTKQLIDALEEFRQLDVDLIPITKQIDTTSPLGKAIFAVISAIASSVSSVAMSCNHMTHRMVSPVGCAVRVYGF